MTAADIDDSIKRKRIHVSCSSCNFTGYIFRGTRVIVVGHLFSHDLSWSCYDQFNVRNSAKLVLVIAAANSPTGQQQLFLSLFYNNNGSLLLGKSKGCDVW